MSFLGSIGRGIAGAISGFVRGGPVGAITGAVGGVSGRNTSPSVAPRINLPATLPGVSIGTRLLPGGTQGPNLPSTFPGAVPEPGFMGGLQRFLPGGQSGFTGAPPGFHLNKAYLAHLRAQAMGKQTQNPFSEPRARNVVVKNRSMNPLNPRALKNANRRQLAAVRLMRATLRGTGYTISRGRFGAKKRRR